MKETYSFLAESFIVTIKLFIAIISIIIALIGTLIIFNLLSWKVVIGIVICLIIMFVYFNWKTNRYISNIEEKGKQEWINSKANMKSAEYEVIDNVKYTRIK